MNRFWLPILYALAAFYIVLQKDVLHEQEWLGDWYVGYAFNLLDGNGYATCAPLADSIRCEPDTIHTSAYRLPVYPLYLTTWLILSGENNLMPIVRLSQALFTSGIVFMAVGYSRHLLTGLLLLFTSTIYQSSNLVLTETLFAFLLMIAFLLLVKSYSRRHAFISGMVLGGVMLTRGLLMFALPGILLSMSNRRWLLFGLVLALAPWITRNAITFQEFIPFSTGSGKVLYGGNSAAAYEEADGAWYKPENLPEWQTQFAHHAGDEVELDRALSRAALENILGSRPRKLLQIARAKTLLSLGWGIRDMLIPLVFFIGLIYMLLFRNSLLARRDTRLILVFWLGAILNILAFWGGIRFRMPFDPLAAIFVGVVFSTQISSDKQ